MRLIELTLLTTACLSGCIIVGEMPKGGWGDTGAFDLEEETGETETEIRVTPDQLAMGSKDVFKVTTEPAIEYELVSDVFTLDDAEVLQFEPTADALMVTIGAVQGGEVGPVTLVLEYVTVLLAVAGAFFGRDSLHSHVPL
jgi:hypothetical protein